MRFAQPIGIGNNVIVKNSAATGTTITLDQIRAGFAPQRLDGTQPSVILVKPPTGQSSNLPQLEGSADFQDVPSSSTTAKIISQLVITKDRKGKSARKVFVTKFLLYSHSDFFFLLQIPQLDGPSGLSDDESDDEFVDDDPAPMTDTIDDDEEEEDLALDDKDVQEEGVNEFFH